MDTKWINLPPPHPVSTSSQEKEQLRQTVSKWMETNEEANDPELVAECEMSGLKVSQTAPDQGQTAPDQGQTAPDQGQTNPDQGQTNPDQEPQLQGEDSGPFVAWLPPTADRPPRKDLAQGNLKVRVKGLRPKDPRTPEPSQLPNVPDRPPTKELAQVIGNLRFRVKGLRKLRVEPGTTSRLEEERPLGRPSGRSPFPGQTAPDPSQIPEEPDRAPRKDLSQVMGNVRVRVRALREERVETATTALPDQEEVKPLGRPSRQNPFRRIKMAWAETKAVVPTDLPPNTPEQQDVVIEAEEEGEATKWLNLRMKDLSTFAARFHCGS
ncbi:unnamed protein product [Gadus morhua 'NCC']